MFNFIKKAISKDDPEFRIDIIRRYQKYIYISILLILWVQLYFVLVQPKLTDFKEKKQRLSDYRRAIAIKKEKMFNKARIEEELKAYHQRLLEKEQRLFSETEFYEFYIKQLSRLAAQYNLDLAVITLEKTMNIDASIKSRGLNMNVVGDYFSLWQFYQELERYPKLVRIVRFSLKKESEKPVKLSCQMALEVYQNNL